MENKKMKVLKGQIPVSILYIALGVCLADLWVRFERLLNPCRRMLSEKRIVLPKGGRR